MWCSAIFRLLIPLHINTYLDWTCIFNILRSFPLWFLEVYLLWLKSPFFITFVLYYFPLVYEFLSFPHYESCLLNWTSGTWEQGHYLVSLMLHRNSKTLVDDIYRMKLNTKVDEIAFIIEIMSDILSLNCTC